MKSYLARPLLIAGLGILSAGASASGEKVDLTIRFDSGKTYISETSLDQRMSMPMGDENMESSSKMKVVSAQKAVAEGEGMTIEQSTVSMLMDMNAGGMAMVFDSENPQGPMAQMLKPLMLAKTTVTLDANGKITKVDAPAIPGMEMMGMGKAELEAAAKTMFDFMPNREMAVGETWKNTSQLPMAGLAEKPVEIAYEMTFAEMTEQDGRDLAKILINGSIESDDENLRITSKKMTGVMLFDPAIGQSRELTITMNLEVGLPAGMRPQGDAPGTMPVNSETVTRLLEVKDSE